MCLHFCVDLYLLETIWTYTNRQHFFDQYNTWITQDLQHMITTMFTAHDHNSVFPGQRPQYQHISTTVCSSIVYPSACSSHFKFLAQILSISHSLTHTCCTVNVFYENNVLGCQTTLALCQRAELRKILINSYSVFIRLLSFSL